MRVLIATGLYPPDIGGPATHTVFLEKHASRLGLELTVVPFGRVRRYPSLIRHIVYLLLLITKSKGVDVLYALDTISVGVPAMLVSMLMRKPLILRVPGDYAWEQGQQRYGITETLDEFRMHTDHPTAVRVLSWLQLKVAQHAAHVIVPSEYMKDIVSEWGIQKEGIVRIYSVLNNIPHTQHVHEGNEREFVIATAGRLVPWKGYHTLIDVVVALKKEGVPVRLDIIGDGVCREELDVRTRAKGAGAYVRFHGRLDRENMAAIIREANVFVLNTSYEGFSHQLLEVMSLGVPIVTTPVGGNRELIIHGETGLLVPYNDDNALRSAIMRLRTDDALARSLRDPARASLHRFNEEQIVSEFETFFNTL
jgi:glycosyltransferase involved in cell wall biosynthesis